MSTKDCQKRIPLASALALLCALVTGCPHNDYTVELKPTAHGVERTLTFYRADGNETNGTPKYEAFPTNELEAITRVYPAGGVKQDGKRYVAKGAFNGDMPADIGGAGSYTNLTSSLGYAGFYLERFRGNDDLAGKTARQLHAADQLTDLVLGWAQAELGSESGYPSLRRFLDEDFRRDLKNAGLYYWVFQVSSLADTNANEAFTARFGQYLIEHSYLKLSDVTQLGAIFGEGGDDYSVLLGLIRRLVTGKMGLPATGSLSPAFAVLKDSKALENSWEKYLSGSDLYRAEVKIWEQEKKTNPQLEQPKPINAVDKIVEDLLGGSDGQADHLTVKLKLAQAPDHTNGRWQDGQVVWDASLEKNRALPAFCYVRWSEPDVAFQKKHFGEVVLEGDELAHYCLWENLLNGKQAGEWKNILAGLHTGQEFKDKLEEFKLGLQ